MTSIINKSDNHLVIGATFIPKGGSADVPDWDAHKGKEHIKQMIEAGAIDQGKAAKADAPAEERARVMSELDRFKVEYDKRLGTDKLKERLAEFKAANPSAQ